MLSKILESQLSKNDESENSFDMGNIWEEDSEPSDAGTPSFLPARPSGSKNKTLQNIKQIRANLREVGRLQREREEQSTQQSALALTKKEQAIAKAILTNQTNKIDHNALVTLFSSPFFQRQVEITPTKKGVAVSAFNRLTKEHVSTGTHRKHTKTYDGAQPEFVKGLARILDLFDVKNALTA